MYLVVPEADKLNILTRRRVFFFNVSEYAGVLGLGPLTRSTVGMSRYGRTVSV